MHILYLYIDFVNSRFRKIKGGIEILNKKNLPKQGFECVSIAQAREFQMVRHNRVSPEYIRVHEIGSHSLPDR